MIFEFEPIGIVRTIDDLGRVNIPRDFRRLINLNVGDEVSVLADKNGNILLMPVKTEEH